MRGGGKIAVARLHADNRPALKRAWRLLLHASPESGATNMAWDIALRRWTARSGVPVLRLYTWSPPALSLGHAQDPNAVVNWEGCRKFGVDVVRRPTGGRAVLHHEELTYALTGRAGDPPFPAAIQDLYARINAALSGSLQAMGLPCRMWDREKTGAVSPRSALPCFAAPGPGEVAVEGRKIIGSAMHIDGGVFLQHGSILIDFDRPMQEGVQRFPFKAPVARVRDYVPQAQAGDLVPHVISSFEEEFGIHFQPFNQEDIDPSDFRSALAKSLLLPPT